MLFWREFRFGENSSDTLYLKICFNPITYLGLDKRWHAGGSSNLTSVKSISGCKKQYTFFCICFMPLKCFVNIFRKSQKVSGINFVNACCKEWGRGFKESLVRLIGLSWAILNHLDNFIIKTLIDIMYKLNCLPCIIASDSDADLNQPYFFYFFYVDAI